VLKRIAALAAVALAAAACTGQPDGRTGADLYETSCAGCHGADLTGGSNLTQGPDIGPGSNAHLVLTDEQLAGVIEVGPGSMPSFGRVLSDEQVASLVAYIRSVQEA
jgi:mono/diheme cytochrome c family protein